MIVLAQQKREQEAKEQAENGSESDDQEIDPMQMRLGHSTGARSARRSKKPSIESAVGKSVVWRLALKFEFG